MVLENSFDVPVGPEQAWAVLMDVPRVITCLPGAQLTDTVDASTWKALVNVKLGPVALAFDTNVHRESADPEALRATLAADARELRGRGAGQATIESSLAPNDTGTHVSIRTDLTLSGTVAQSGRMVEAVSAQLVRSFADCLEAQLAGSEQEAAAAVETQSAPVRGGSLALRSLVERLRRLLGRRF